MAYQIFSSSADPHEAQLCKMFDDRPLRCAAGCAAVLPATHIHLWFADSNFATGVCSEACAGLAIRRRPGAALEGDTDLLSAEPDRLESRSSQGSVKSAQG